jgi:phospholipid/cholesterol/gamma-HCH transport system ATP-binding protein
LGVALPAIELREVSISFSGESILEKVSLSVFQGETLVLIGSSGQGKSILMKVMAGLVPPQSGEVLIDGENILTASVARRQELMCKMGMLFQKNALFDSLSNYENIAFPLREVTDLSEEKIEQTVDQYLQAVGLNTAKHLFPDEISGGMQKRLGIARALALNPQLIFYDDPTAGLDPITSRKIIELIIDLKKRNNSTVVAVTNEMSRAYQMADRIAMVVDRSVVITGNVQQTKESNDPRVHQFVHGELAGPLTGLE